MTANKPFFTADLHLGHTNCIKYCNRPFTDAHHMNETLIDNWNSVVGAKDEVYLLGDVSFSPLVQTCSMLQRLKGKKYLIAGNHDAKLRKQAEFTDCFEWVKDYCELKVQDADVSGGNQNIVMSHFPMLSWNRSRYGSWMLHGHTHGQLQSDTSKYKRYDVGVDPNEFTPIRYEKLKTIFSDSPDVDIVHP